MKERTAIGSDSTVQSCPHFNRCSAPLCPLDVDLHVRDGWYADEAICRHPDYQKDPMIRRQRRLARVAKRKKSDGDEFYSTGLLFGATPLGQKCTQRKGAVKVAL